MRLARKALAVSMDVAGIKMIIQEMNEKAYEDTQAQDKMGKQTDKRISHGVECVGNHVRGIASQNHGVAVNPQD